MRLGIKKELVKRDIESNLINVTVINSVVYLDGEVRPIRGVTLDVRKERDLIEEIIRNFRGVRDVVNNLRIPL